MREQLKPRVFEQLEPLISRTPVLLGTVRNTDFAHARVTRQAGNTDFAHGESTKTSSFLTFFFQKQLVAHAGVREIMGALVSRTEACAKW